MQTLAAASAKRRSSSSRSRIAFSPIEGARLARQVELEDGTIVKPARGDAQPVDLFLRGWPVAGAVAQWAETEEEFVARIAARDVPAGATNVEIVDASAIPADRTFRDAWAYRPGGCQVDMAKAREIHRGRLRELRAPKLAALDVDYLRALERGAPSAEIAAIAAKKQALRDAPADPAIEAAATPEALRAVMPRALQE